ALEHSPDAPLDAAVDDVARVPSVALLLQRAAASMPGFALTAGNRMAIAGICARLDGLPLALELAAPHLKVTAPETLLTQLDAQLEGRLNLLVDGPRDLPPRQQTLRATLTWSYTLLSPSERMMFRRLGVFAGGCTQDAIAQVASPVPNDA